MVAASPDPKGSVKAGAKSAPAVSLATLSLAELEAITAMQDAAYATLSRVIDCPPVRVAITAASDRQHRDGRTGTRYVSAARSGDGHARVEVAVKVGEHAWSAIVAAAVAAGLAAQKHPVTGPSTRDRVLREQRKLLAESVAQVALPAKPGAACMQVAAILEPKGRPDTSPLSRAISAAEQARAGRPIFGASADAGALTGARYAAEWSEDTESGPIVKHAELRPAKLYTDADIGSTVEVLHRITPKGGGTVRTVVARSGVIVLEGRNPKTRRPMYFRTPEEVEGFRKRGK